MTTNDYRWLPNRLSKRLSKTLSKRLIQIHRARDVTSALVVYHFSYKGKGVDIYINVYSKNNSNDKISHYSLKLRLYRRTVFPSTLFGQMDTCMENINQNTSISLLKSLSIDFFNMNISFSSWYLRNVPPLAQGDWIVRCLSIFWGN